GRRPARRAVPGAAGALVAPGFAPAARAGGTMKALVIGGSGLVGGALVRALGQAEADVIAAYHSRPRPGGVRLDVREPRAVCEAFDAAKPDVVVWAVAAPGGIDGAEPPLAEVQALEADGLAHVIAACRRSGARLVYVSTDEVFDGAHGPYGEDAAPRPVTAYGGLKSAGERLALEAPGAL